MRKKLLVLLTFVILSMALVSSTTIITDTSIVTDGDLSVQGLSVLGELEVTGNSNVSGNSDVSGDLEVFGNVGIGGPLDPTRGLKITSSGSALSLNAASGLDIIGTAGIWSISRLGFGSLQGLVVTGPLDVQGTSSDIQLAVRGNSIQNLPIVSFLNNAVNRFVEIDKDANFKIRQGVTDVFFINSTNGNVDLINGNLTIQNLPGGTDGCTVKWNATTKQLFC